MIKDIYNIFERCDADTARLKERADDLVDARDNAKERNVHFLTLQAIDFELAMVLAELRVIDRVRRTTHINHHIVAVCDGGRC